MSDSRKINKDALAAAEARIAELEAERDEARHSLYLREHGQHAEAWYELEAALDAEQEKVKRLVETVGHVLAHGRLGKQSKRRLRAILSKVEEA